MSSGLDQFDLDGALLRRSETELRAFAEALAVRLEGALPGRVTIERRRDGLLSSARHVSRITVRGESALYELKVDKAGLSATRAKLVRGVTISTATISPRDWLGELGGELQALAERAGTATDTLSGFL
ncbi:MAG: hypothetical protein ACREEW_07115 [Caulobacteraceae bacterium]